MHNNPQESNQQAQLTPEQNQLQYQQFLQWQAQQQVQQAQQGQQANQQAQWAAVQQAPQLTPQHAVQPPEGTYQPIPSVASQAWQATPFPSQPVQYPPQQWQQPPLPTNQGQVYASPQVQQPQQVIFAPPVVQPIVMPQQVVNVNIQQHQHSLFVRALYFLFIGWWAGWMWLNIGYFLVLTVVGIPLGLVMLNRLPTVLTLKPTSQSVNINITGNTTNITIGGVQQVNFLIRALYFIFVGWWAGLLWAYAAYILFVLVVTIPLGVMMLDMLPAVITLRKH